MYSRTHESSQRNGSLKEFKNTIACVADFLTHPAIPPFDGTRFGEDESGT